MAKSGQNISISIGPAQLSGWKFFSTHKQIHTNQNSSKLLFELRCLCVFPSVCLSVFLQKKNFRPKQIKFANSVNRHLEFQNASQKGLISIIYKTVYHISTHYLLRKLPFCEVQVQQYQQGFCTLAEQISIVLIMHSCLLIFSMSQTSCIGYPMYQIIFNLKNYLVASSSFGRGTTYVCMEKEEDLKVS